MDWESERPDAQTYDPALHTQVYVQASCGQRRKVSSHLLPRRHQRQDSATRVDS